MFFVWVTVRTRLVTPEFLLFVFSSCALPIMQEPLGKQELAGKSVFDVRDAESQATELLRSDTACVWAKKTSLPGHDSSGSHCCLRCLPQMKRADRGGIKGSDVRMPLAFTWLGLSNHHVWSLHAQKAATNVDSCFAAIPLIKRWERTILWHWHFC